MSCTLMSPSSYPSALSSMDTKLLINENVVPSQGSTEPLTSSFDEEDVFADSCWSPCLYSLQMKAPLAKPLSTDATVDVPNQFGTNYHGLISKAEAVDLLWNKEDGTYLIRRTMSGKYVISLSFGGTVHHKTILYNNDTCVYDDKEYATIEELVNDSLIYLYIEKHEDVTQTLSRGRHKQQKVKQEFQCKRRLARYKRRTKTSEISDDSVDGISPTLSISSLNDEIDDTTSLDIKAADQNRRLQHKGNKSATLISPRSNNYLAIPRSRTTGSSSLQRHKASSEEDISQLSKGDVTSLIQNLKTLSKNSESPKLPPSLPGSLPASRSSSASSYDKSHNFASCTYKRPTWCDICRHFMWGIVLQGHCCQDCGINVHKQCLETAGNVECIPNRKMIKRVFGIDLTTLVILEGSKVPNFLQQSVNAIESNFLDMEGLYRVSGGTSKVLDIKEKFNEGEEINWEQMYDIHVITGVIKSYFRELPMPLITYDVYPLAIQSVKDFPEIKSFCNTVQQMLMFSLPKSHYDTLYFFMKHLNKIALHCEGNKMKSSNLAVVFAPTLMRPLTDDGAISIANLPYEQKFIDRLITNVDSIFVNLR